MMIKICCVVAGVMIVLLCGFRVRNAGGPSIKTGTPDSVSFRREVAPVLRRFCLPCHTEENMNPSGLYLDSYGNLMKGGRHGSPVASGKPDSSTLILKMSANPPFGDPMPLRARRAFPADTIQLLRRWILQGAKDN
jgi:hypothetical protein